MLLGKTASDRDYVLTGVHLSDMPMPKIAGKDFPVFLVEINGVTSEVALARKERKVSEGYHGFEFYTDPNITIEQDLIRRDLTINAMVIDVETGELIDPYGGQKDLRDRVLRHTSDAFKEDPLRCYRVARFAAKFGYAVALETKELMLSLRDELCSLTPERVALELTKALVSPFPDKFFRELDGLLDVHFPEIEALKVPDRHDGTAFEHTLACLYRGNGLEERFGLLVHDLGKGLSENPPVHNGHQMHEHLVQALGDRLRLPNKLIKFGRTTMRLHMKLKSLHEMRIGKLFRLVDHSIFKQLKLSYLESGGRYDRKLYLSHVELCKQVIRIKRQITGQVLLDRGILPDQNFGMKLLQERIREFKQQNIAGIIAGS
jgi:tRNA nucleotidyltransferase (CCA-adding enzyme)